MHSPGEIIRKKGLLSRNKQYILQSAGFSLMEVLISLALIGMVFCFLIQIIIAGHFAIRQGSEIVNATNIAHETMEHIKILGYDKAFTPADFDGAAGVTPVNDYPPLPYPKVTVGGIDYFIRVTNSKPPVAGNLLTQVNIVVSWESKNAFSMNEGGGAGKTMKNITLSTMLRQEL